jgi:hypothetical protein
MTRFVLAMACTAAAAATALAVATPLPAAGTAWRVTPVASGLDSPRGLAIADGGALYVAEGGHGGDVCKSPAFCIGTTARISRVDAATGTRTTIVGGLYSRMVAGEGITGANGLAARGGRLLATITSFPQELAAWSCAGQPADCSAVLAAARAQAGRLISFTPAGASKPVAGVGSNDVAWAAAHPSFSREPANANPYGVFALPSATLVADAGANTLDVAAANGATAVASALAPPPPGGFPADAVPTCVTVARGNAYIGSLSGKLWKRAGSFTPTEVPVPAGLLHHVTGCTSDAKGDIFLVDMWGTPGPPIPAGPGSAAGTGSVVEVAADGTATVLAQGLMFPNGIGLARDGSLYVSVGSTCTAQGTPFPYCTNGGGIVRLSR